VRQRPPRQSHEQRHDKSCRHETDAKKYLLRRTGFILSRRNRSNAVSGGSDVNIQNSSRQHSDLGSENVFPKRIFCNSKRRCFSIQRWLKQPELSEVIEDFAAETSLGALVG
jgi:hypothetical protein